MKKLLKLLFITTSILIFVFVYLSFKEKDTSDAYNYFGLKQTEGYKSIVFDGNLGDFPMKEFIDVVYEFKESESGPITFIQTELDYVAQEYQYYILSDKSLEDLFDFQGLTELINVPGDIYYASTDSSLSSNKIDLINKEITLHIRPLSTYSSSNNIMLEFFGPEDAFARFITQIDEKYSKYSPEIVDFQNAQFDFQNDIRNNMFKVLSISVVLLLVIFLFYISKSLKMISVLKLQGYSNIAIFKYILLNDILVMFGLSIFVNIILFISVVGHMSSKSQLMISYLVRYNSLMLGLILVSSTLFIVGTRLISLSSIIKGRNLNKTLATIAYCIKILAIILLVPMISNNVEPLLENSMNLYNLRINENSYLNSYKIPRYADAYREKKTFFTGRSDETVDFEYQNHAKLVDDLTLIGAEYVSASSYLATRVDTQNEEKELNTLSVNENYVNNHLTSSLSKVVSEYLKDQDVVILINKKINESYIIEPNNLIEFGLTYSALEVRLPSNLFTYSNPQPEIILVYGNSTPRLNKTVFNNIILNDISKSDAERVAREYGLENQFFYQNMSDDFRVISRNLLNSVMIGLLNIVPVFIILLIVGLSFYETYRKANNQQIIVKTIHGYPLFSIYYDFLIETLLPIVLVLIMDKGNLLKSSVALISIELIIWVLIVMQTKRRKISSVVKREEM